MLTRLLERLREVLREVALRTCLFRVVMGYSPIVFFARNKQIGGIR